MIYHILKNRMVDRDYYPDIVHTATGVMRLEGDRVLIEYTCSDFRYAFTLQREADGHFRGEVQRLENPGKSYYPSLALDLEIHLDSDEGTFSGVLVENGHEHTWEGDLERA
jgi:hypothetical protein